jgi:hypothetical protein
MESTHVLLTTQPLPTPLLPIPHRHLVTRYKFLDLNLIIESNAVDDVRGSIDDSNVFVVTDNPGENDGVSRGGAA